MEQRVQYFIVTGEPGVGKTTLIKKLSSLLNENGIKTSGFYTEELRKNGVREGFDVVTFGGKRGTLARTANLVKNPSKFMVGKYVVDVKEFESKALPSLELEMRHQNILIIDEIGKMELFSQCFRNRINEMFNQNSGCLILATIPIKKGIDLIERIRHHPKSKVWTITSENRNTVSEEILENIKTNYNL